MISDLKDANIAMAQRLAIVEFQLQNRNEKQLSARKSKRPATAAVAVAPPAAKRRVWPYALAVFIAVFGGIRGLLAGDSRAIPAGRFLSALP